MMPSTAVAVVVEVAAGIVVVVMDNTPAAVVVLDTQTAEQAGNGIGGLA